MNKLPERKRNRLKDFDYSLNGAYFVTICIEKGRNLLWMSNIGAISNCLNGFYKLSNYGLAIERAIHDIPTFYPHVNVDKYVIMPNHIHMILLVSANQHSCGRLITAPTLSTIIQQFKGTVTKQTGFSLWQKSFYDTVIRNEKAYQEIWRYIDENPLKWELDEYYSVY